MECKFKISEAMDIHKVSKLGLPENKVLRMPLALRNKLGIKLGYVPNFTNTDGSLISLFVIPARHEDIAYSDCACITSDVAEALGIKNGDIKEVVRYEGITLGCDPEFFLVNVNTGKPQSASMFFSKWDDVGYDGMMAELRPFPSVSEEVVTDNLYNLIQKARHQIDTSTLKLDYGVSMLAASTFSGMSAGFHLHYGIPMHLLGQPPKYSTKEKLINLMIKAMDFYLGIPSIIPEGIYDSTRRTHPFLQYGKPGEYRIDLRTLEYRVPGGALLKHPILTKGLMALGAVIVEDIVSRFNECTDSFKNLETMTSNEDLQELYKNVPSTMDIINTICSVSLDQARYYLPIIKSDVEKMVGYNRRADSIDQFFNLLMSDVIPYSNNIEANWREYYNAETPRAMEFCSN